MENWLSKAGNSHTKAVWKSNWLKFAEWVTDSKNPLTSAPYMTCSIDKVDEIIRSDFENMPSHLFQDKYRDILSKYLVSFGDLKSNTVRAKISAVQSFLTNEATSIRLQHGKIPKAEMAKNEHRFVLEELRKMWLVADIEGKARLSVAVSLGWSVGDFLNLETGFIREVIKNVDAAGFASFDYQRHKTKARVRGILTPNATHDLNNYLSKATGKYLWSSRTKEGINAWFKALYVEAGIGKNGTVRFHLLRKYTYGIVVNQCGTELAKLLVGKTIPIEDATYLQNLETDLLEKYEKFAYPFLKLEGNGQIQTSEIQDRINHLETSLRTVVQQMSVLTAENTNLRNNYFHTEGHSGEEMKLIQIQQNEIKELQQKVDRLEKEKGSR